MAVKLAGRGDGLDGSGCALGVKADQGWDVFRKQNTRNLLVESMNI